MPTDNSAPAPRELPERPNLRHLKDQAKDLLATGVAESLTDAQFQIACQYGFPSWPKLKAHVDALHDAGKLKEAINNEDLELVKQMLTRNPELHKAPIGYGKNGALTWVAECRVPFQAPSPARLAIAKWMIDNGSDIHQNGDGPLMRASLNRERIQMMELLVEHGADVNAHWHGWFPMLFSPAECVNPPVMRWLLAHGADPNCLGQKDKVTALDYLIGTYGRSNEFRECVEILLAAGGVSKYDVPGVMAILRGRTDLLAESLAADPGLIHRRYPELDCGTTGSRRPLLVGATLLHVAAEYGETECASLLLNRGADVNARSDVNANGVGGQTPIFHAASQYDDWGLNVARLLLDHGADLAVRVKIPGEYERPDEVVECTPLGYALKFPGVESETVQLLRERGGVE
jgi:ankyrin repeat protein